MMTEEQAKSLLLKQENVYTRDPQLREPAFAYCEGYKAFLNAAKTEREAVEWAVREAEANGFVPYDPTVSCKPGDRVYRVNRGKSVMLAVIGTDAPEAGFSIVVSHIDSPRLDLKQRPLYETAGISYFKTHYYGGIKKYQWTALPLALHGTVMTESGGRVDVRVGEAEGEPVFFISDLMPHIAKDQYEKKLGDAISGEGLNIINGSLPLGEGGDAVKLGILALLHEKYGITEADLRTAELSAVPAQKAVDVGFDASMIAAYGQDDRVCAYPSLTALFETKAPARTCVVVLADKEEIGSEGVTGLRSAALAHFLTSLCENRGADYKTCFAASDCLSADVGGAYDPCYAEAYEAGNSAYLNHGVAVMKYTGARGKSGSSDASAELLAKLARIFRENDVVWQTGEYGKVDQGGAGTVATEIAMLNISVVDTGVPILSMHSPVELAAKADIYMLHRALAAYFADR
ncbi:MAG: aminopeptidase [Clostridiales bacterium]|nr:MAG: aminopeptidase [Clostridiales bacterium]